MASVTRRAHGARAQRRAENLAKLLDALEALLAEGESFTEVSVERLAARAGVSRSTFYVHFADKGQLLSELTADVVDQLLEAGRGWWGHDPPASRDDLRAKAETIVATYRPRAELMRAVIDSSSHDPAVREVFRALTGRYVTEIAAHIETGQEAGTVRRDVPPGPTAQMLTSMAERGLDRMLRGADDAAARDAVEAFTAIVWNTLYRDAP
ncbi:TetR/AcrR family transcriptional regulator [Actinomycetospora rhizophila]|uniref:TetR/AcrR family transcriptional regulator n=1 Tax=Actinomycetospora rhizophila TaxID=1416876 RepID=A0ABV9ZQ06_9PSEU